MAWNVMNERRVGRTRSARPMIRHSSLGYGLRWSGGGRSLDLLRLGFAVADGDAAGLKPLRHVAHQLDMEQAVLDAGALHLDVIGELETALEVARGDAAVQELALLLLGLLGAGDGERLLLDVDAELVLAEAGHRHGNAVLVIAEPLDVVRRVARRGLVEPGHRVEQVEQAVEADGGAIEGGKIDGSHHRSSFRSDVCLCLPTWGGTNLPRGPGSSHAHPTSGMRDPYVGAAGAASRGRLPVTNRYRPVGKCQQSLLRRQIQRNQGRVGCVRAGPYEDGERHEPFLAGQ